MTDEMQHLETIIRRLGISRRGATAQEDEAEICPHCKGAGYLRYDVPVDDPRFGRLVVCECTRAELEAKRHQILLERSRLRNLRHLTFDNWESKYDGKPPQGTPDWAYEQAMRYRTKLSIDNRPWLFLYGTVGTGKTRIAAAIGNYRIDLGEPAVFMVVPELLDYLRAAYSPNSDIGYDELFESLKNTPLLILDELGVESATPWAREKLYQLINHRYNSRLPTVITMNMEVGPESIDERLWSRINDRQLTTVCEVRDRDYRTGRQAAKRRSDPVSRKHRPKLREEYHI
jgi:DNA replication protein DnaC